MDFKIPTKFSVGGLDYRVEETGSLRYGEEYGHWDGSRCLILLAHRAGGEELSEERKAQTFFHELTHAVLDAIGEDELNENEQFIDAFSNLFYQALKTMEQAMIVSELIEALQQMPEDRTVMLYYDADLDTPDRVYINESPFENENGAVVIY